jgi:hypothetical protein
MFCVILEIFSAEKIIGDPSSYFTKQRAKRLCFVSSSKSFQQKRLSGLNRRRYDSKAERDGASRDRTNFQQEIMCDP